jgi:general secretion pathway protein L
MAAPVLKRGEAVVWLPPRADGERAFGTEARLLATVSDGAGTLRYARVSLDGMQPASQVRLVFDPRDVTLVPAAVPALSGTRLAQALPNIVEDSLLQDPSTCAMVAGPPLPDGRRTIGVVDRGWLEFTVGAFERRGIRVRSAVPGQLALPLHPEQWSLGCVHGGLALRIGPFEGLGWSAGPDPDYRAEAIVALVGTSLADRPRPSSIAAYAEDTSWREPIARAAERLGIEFKVSGLPLPDAAGVDLLAGRTGAGRRMLQSFELRDWSWPIGLAAACVVAALVGLNLHWATMVRERQEIRASLERTFRSAFPEAQVVVDPVLQMNRQVAMLRARGGQSGPEDFVPLLARFSQALGPRVNDALASLEYRDGRLKVRFQPQLVDGAAAREQLAAACLRAGLRLAFDNDRDPTATVAIQS